MPGRSSDEVLISCHVCHPSLANDNLSGITVATALAAAICRDGVFAIRIGFYLFPGRSAPSHGLRKTAFGRANSPWLRADLYRRRRRLSLQEEPPGNMPKSIGQLLASCSDCGEPFEILDFSPYGYDERQYCSPGFNLPVGCLMRSVWGTFPEYHSSADDLTFIRPDSLARLFACASASSTRWRTNRRYINQNPCCEPQLGKRNLYRSTGGESIGSEINARLWVLNFSDGENSLLDIAERSGLPFSSLLKLQICCASMVFLSPPKIARTGR